MNTERPSTPTMLSTVKVRSRQSVQVPCRQQTSSASEKQLLKRIAGKAGLTAHLGTNDMKEIQERIKNGDKQAQLITDAMIYHTAKQIAAEGAVLCGNVDAILLTGGMAHSDYITNELRRRIGYLAPIYCFPGENEMEALALNALSVLKGTSKAQIYQ